MKRTYCLYLVLFMFLLAGPVFAERINSRKNIEKAEKMMPKIERYIEEELVDNAEDLWQKAYQLIQKTYKDRKKMPDDVIDNLKKSRSDVEKKLRLYRGMIDAKKIQKKVRDGDAKGAMEYLSNTLRTPFYEDVGQCFIGNSYFKTGQFFLEEDDYDHAMTCFIEAREHLEDCSYSDRDDANNILRDLLVSTFDLNVRRGNFQDAYEDLNSIVRKERNNDSDDRYKKYKDIQDTFPMYVLNDFFKKDSPEVAYEQFNELLEGPYGQKLTASQKSQYYDKAATFFKNKNKAELATNCQNKKLEMLEDSLDSKDTKDPEQENMLTELKEQNLEKAESNKDYVKVFEIKKTELGKNIEKFGKTDPRVLQECLDDMNYFFEVGESDSANYFWEIFSNTREEIKAQKVSRRNNLSAFFFFVYDLENYAENFNDKENLLYEPTRQKIEHERRTIFAPQGNKIKEFRFWELYSQFLQKQDETGDDIKDLTHNLFEMIQDPVFQQYEYYKPILTLGTYFQRCKNFKEATFCANLSEDIISFFAAPDAPDVFFPVVLRAAVLKDSGNSERAIAELDHLASYGILQRMTRISSMNMNEDDSVLNAWPFGKLNQSMNTKTLFLKNSADTIPIDLVGEKINHLVTGKNPIPIIIKFANQYEKNGQYTQALLLYQFTEPFYKNSPDCLSALEEKVYLLEDKRKETDDLM